MSDVVKNWEQAEAILIKDLRDAKIDADSLRGELAAERVENAWLRDTIVKLAKRLVDED